MHKTLPQKIPNAHKSLINNADNFSSVEIIPDETFVPFLTGDLK
jgi:hypothetical protein